MPTRSVGRPLALILPLLLAGPGCPTGDDDDVSDDDAPAFIQSVQVDVSDVIGTVVTLSWATEEPTAGRVEFGVDGSLDRQVVDPADIATDHQVTLLGLTADTEVDYRIVALDDDTPLGSLDGTFTTGPLPPELSGELIQHHVPDPDAITGGHFAVSLFSEVSVPVILDERGNPVWWHLDETPHEVITTVRLSRDRSSVYYNAFRLFDEDNEVEDERIIRVSLDGREVQRISAVGHTHDFVELADGSIGYITADGLDVDGLNIRGDRIVEWRPDGTEEEIWSVWDDLEYDPDLDPPAGTGYTHANALDLDENEDAYFLSLRSQDCVLKIDRAAGELEWVLGGPYSTVQIVGTDPHSDQHQFHVYDDRVLIFDNGDVSRYASRAVEYTLDLEQRRAELAWEHFDHPPVYIISGGDVTRLPGGTTLVTWSSAGMLDEVDETGHVLWRLYTRVGYGFGFTEWIEDIDRR